MVLLVASKYTTPWRSVYQNRVSWGPTSGLPHIQAPCCTACSTLSQLYYVTEGNPETSNPINPKQSVVMQ